MHISIKHKETEMLNDKDSDKNQATKLKESIKFLSCDDCSYETTSKGALDEHMERGHIEEKEFNCMGCDFQTTTEHQLKKHFTLKHTLQGLKQDEEIRCRICGDSFKGKRSLMIHRKNEHRGSVAKCKNYQDANCPFSSEKCWWIHTEVGQIDKDVACFTCDKKFENKDKMMIYRKSEHKALVRICNQFKKNKCKLQNKVCWFLHKNEVMDTEVIKNKNDTEDSTEETSNLVFQKVSENMKPT